jgi:hypothetical protein
MIVTKRTNSSATVVLISLNFKERKKNKCNKYQAQDNNKQQIEQDEFEKSFAPALAVKVLHGKVFVHKQAENPKTDDGTQQTPMQVSIQSRKTE